MSENDTLHLWFKPYGCTLNEGDLAFVERYGKRFYPRAMSELATRLHSTMARIVKLCPPQTFQYQLTHRTSGATNRYVIEENLRDREDVTGLQMGIQATNQEERALFNQCFIDEESVQKTTQSIQNVIAYLSDSIEMENHKWANAKMQNGADAIPVVYELISFLKAIKNFARVYSFELSQTETGMNLTMALICPTVLAYYTRIDWKIA